MGTPLDLIIPCLSDARPVGTCCILSTKERCSAPLSVMPFPPRASQMSPLDCALESSASDMAFTPSSPM